MDAAAKRLEHARAEQKATEDEVVRLKAEAAKIPPPPGMTEKLAAARAVRAKARQAATNALEVLQAKTKQSNAPKEEFAQVKAANPADALAAAKALVAKLKAAQVQSNVYRARESLAAKKREQEKLLAIAAEKQEH